MRAVARLAELNQADQVVDGLRSRLAELTEALKEPTTLRSARQALAAIDAEIAELSAQQRDLELRQQSAAAKRAHDEQVLYSGNVHNPKELRDLEAEMQQSRRQQGQSEDALLELLIAVEAAEARQAAARAVLTRMSGEWQTSQAGLRTEQARLNRRLEVEQARQVAARTAAPAHLLPLYDTLRSRKGGRAVATLDGDSCSACKVAVSPTKAVAVRDGDELVYCENCGRLLFGE